MKVNQNLVITIAPFLVVGGLAVLAVSSNYPGKIELKIGLNGIQLQITGQDDIKRLDKPVLDKPVIVDN